MKKERFSWSGMHPFFHDPFLSYFTPDLRNKIVLDCGCGKGVVGYLTRATRDLEKGKMIGIDSSASSIEFCKKYNVYDKLIRHRLPTIPMKEKSVDFLVCTEVIEHFNQKDGEKLLMEIDRVCKGRSIITTPNMFFPTSPGTNEDEHKSLWTASSFRKYGYKVYGLGFKVVLDNTDPLYKIKQALHYFFAPISYYIPEMSGFLLCVKDY